MWIVRLALRRPYTFVVAALLLLLMTPFVLTKTDRKSTRLNSSHVAISYAVFCFIPHTHLHSFPTRRSSDLTKTNRSLMTVIPLWRTHGCALVRLSQIGGTLCGLFA